MWYNDLRHFSQQEFSVDSKTFKQACYSTDGQTEMTKGGFQTAVISSV